MSPKSSPSRNSRPSRSPSSHFHQLQQDGVFKSNSVLLHTSEKQQTHQVCKCVVAIFDHKAASLHPSIRTEPPAWLLLFRVALFFIIFNFAVSGPSNNNKRWMWINVPVNLVLLLVPTFKAAMEKNKEPLFLCVCVWKSLNVCSFGFL